MNANGSIGRSSVPCVLVADDNSNIQKMVTLALKDAGIAVVAVPNGQAAVRKIPEIMPDLVLADIFMPVQSGYEVCEFVKKDPRFAHIPVVLLIGAFDPFDEREAERVHADGVLKKPFVPPDPLINMVKTQLGPLLEHPAEQEDSVFVPAGVPAGSPDTHLGHSESFQAELSRGHVSSQQTSSADLASHSIHEARDSAAHRVEMAQGATSAERTISESQENSDTSVLLPELPTVDTQAESVVTSSRDPILGEPVFWRQPAEPHTAPEETGQGHMWNLGVSPMRKRQCVPRGLRLNPTLQSALIFKKVRPHKHSTTSHCQTRYCRKACKLASGHQIFPTPQ